MTPRQRLEEIQANADSSTLSNTPTADFRFLLGWIESLESEIAALREIVSIKIYATPYLSNPSQAPEYIHAVMSYEAVDAFQKALAEANNIAKEREKL